ncbi:MAG: rRNA pseudouridine synthase [Gemmatimonadetes bacterium]|nr:rRNA pseudouridine synthase [Gemmatimonadota bacterium]
MTLMRLQRAMARAGFGSRRGAEELIRAGRVRVNGVVAQLGMSVDPERDVILVGTRRVVPARPEWLALHKPLGYVVSRRDPQGRPTVFDLVPPVRGLTYVGRLDVMTSGLLLLTNDGEAAHRLMHPRFAVQRSYQAVVHGRSGDDLRRALARPVVIEGRPVRLVRWRVAAAEAGASRLTVVLAEGRYRIVRRLCDRLGLKVERLIRLSYGPIRLETLKPAEWRRLSGAEVRALGATTGKATGHAA